MSRACSVGLGLAVLLANLAAVRGEDARKPRTDLYGDPLPPGALARLGTIRLRHGSGVYIRIAFSEDGKQLLSGAFNEIRIWDMTSGKLVQRKQLWKSKRSADRPAIKAFSPDGMLAVSADKFSIYLSDTATGAERGRLTGNHPWPLRFSPDGKLLAVEDRSGSNADGRRIYYVWDFTADRKRPILKTIASFKMVKESFSLDAKRLAGIGAEDRVLHLWDPASGEEIRAASRIKSCEDCLAFSPDGKILAVGVKDAAKVRLLDVSTLKERTVLKAPGVKEASGFSHLAFSPDARWLAGSNNGLIFLWDLVGTKNPQIVPAGQLHDPPVFSLDSKTLAWKDINRSTIPIWNLASDRQQFPWSGHDRPVATLAVSPDGKTIASGDSLGRVCLWDAATGRLRHSMEAEACRCFFSPDGKRLICAGMSGCLQVLDVAAGKPLRRSQIDLAPSEVVDLRSAALSADGERLTVIARLGAAGIDEAGTSRLYRWNIAVGGQVRPLSDHGRKALELTPGGESLTVELDDRIGIADLATGSLRAMLPKDLKHTHDYLVFSPDGRLVAAGLRSIGPTDISLIELASGQEMFRVTGVIYDTTFLPDSRGLITADRKGGLCVWDTTTGERLHRMAWPESILDVRTEMRACCSLTVLPNGRVVTGQSEGDILLWDLAPAIGPRIVRPASDLGRKELSALWSDLLGDARTAHRTIGTLTAAPARAVPFLSEYLQPIMVDGKRIEKLLADLDSDSFETREAAARELSRLRYRAEKMLRQVLEGRPSLEMRRRLQAILAEPNRPPAEALRTLRAITVLERTSTPEARRILEKLASGAVSPETRTAQAALQRLKCRDTWAKEKSSP